MWAQQICRMRGIWDAARGPFARSVALVAIGTAASQLIAMLFMPIVTRVYGPDAVGAANVFSSISSIVAPVAALGYPVALVLPSRESDGLRIARLSIAIGGVTSLIALAAVIAVNRQLVHLLHIEEIASFTYLIPVSMFLTALMSVIDQWTIRRAYFGIKARVATMQSFLLNGSKVALGLVNPTAAVLVVLTAFGPLLQALMVAIRLPRREAKRIIGPVRSRDFRLAREYSNFPFYRAPEQLLNGLSQGLPVLMLSSFFGPSSAGYYGLAVTTLGLPVTLIGNAMGDVFFSQAAKVTREGGRIRPLLSKATFALLGASIVPFGLLIVLGPFLFGLVFGANWTMSGAYAAWLAPWYMFVLANRPSLMSLQVMAKQRLFLGYTITSTVIRAAVLFGSYDVWRSSNVSIIFFGTAGAVLNIALIVTTSILARQHDLRRSRLNGQIH